MIRYEISRCYFTEDVIQQIDMMRENTHFRDANNLDNLGNGRPIPRRAQKRTKLSQSTHQGDSYETLEHIVITTSDIIRQDIRDEGRRSINDDSIIDRFGSSRLSEQNVLSLTVPQQGLNEISHSIGIGRAIIGDNQMRVEGYW
ncbi:atp-dependent dna helicase [Lasius niger]|uniref:Atp-dependent dna helicase n=1 Tax=Lasius niger TaxID=67767 RepID=A0A0J7KV20_LASNI|nr:atp-dependent dna helicase [Lasius niger]